MWFSDLLTLFGRNPAGGFNPAAAAALAGLTLDQIDLLLRDPKAIGGPPDAMTEREHHRRQCWMNNYPDWLTEKLWRERHPTL